MNEQEAREAKVLIQAIDKLFEDLEKISTEEKARKVKKLVDDLNEVHRMSKEIDSLYEASMRGNENACEYLADIGRDLAAKLIRYIENKILEL